MSKTIHVFTGTGNSLHVARCLASGLQVEVERITGAGMQADAGPDDMVGIVFPVYHGTLPRIVRRFVQALTAQGAYLFGVCTYGDTAGRAIADLQALLGSHGMRLAAGWAIQMPYNYLTPSLRLRGFWRSFTLRQTKTERRQELDAVARDRCADIIRQVDDHTQGPFETKVDPLHGLLDRLVSSDDLAKAAWMRIAGCQPDKTRTFWESVPFMDSAFWADNHCTGCGICAKVCPVQDIRMVDGRPQWQHDCEQCFACLQWCPAQAIQFGSNTAGASRYQHSAIALRDMLLR